MDGLDQRIRLRIDVNVAEARWWATPPASATEAPGMRMGWLLHGHLLQAGLAEHTPRTSSPIASSVAERLLLCVSSAVGRGGWGADIAVHVAGVIPATTSTADTVVSLDLDLPADEGLWQTILPPKAGPGSLAERVCAAIATAIETSRLFVAVEAGITAAVVPDGGCDG